MRDVPPSCYCTAMTTTTAPAPLTTSAVEAIKARGGQITYRPTGERVVTYPAWAADVHAAELREELYTR